MEIYWTSDLHFGHEKITEIRGFRNVAEHDAAVFDSLASVLRPGDRLINLGDNSIESTWESGLNYMRALGVETHLYIGNHDRVFPGKRDAHKFFRSYAEVFESVQLFARHKLDNREFMVSHMPYWPYDRHEPRLQQYRPVNLGLPIVHGHTHSDGTEDFPGHLHVGWDAWKRPVAQNEIMEWLARQHVRKGVH